MRILITGSRGLIGSALKKRLQNFGMEVIDFDIKDGAENTILDEQQLYQQAQDCQGIVHLAAVSRVIYGERNPELCWETNAGGTERVLRVAQALESTPWVLYASSREVYGEPLELPVCESAPLCPINIYGESKLEAEHLVQKYAKQGVQTAITRLSNVFGSVEDYPDRVIPAFCRAAAFGNDIRVEGGENLFDFTYIEDVAEGLVKIIALLNNQDCSLPPIHFTTGRGASLQEVAHIAKEASEYSIEIVEHPSRTFDVTRFAGNPGKAQEILGWEPQISVREGVHRLIHAFRGALANTSLA